MLTSVCEGNMNGILYFCYNFSLCTDCDGRDPLPGLVIETECAWMLCLNQRIWIIKCTNALGLADALIIL